jgi:hypothetical protein
MSYLDAPQTKMLATHCCVCGRPLGDARSVELGIGPECGEHLHALWDDSMGEDQRRLANQLVHAAAVYAQQGRISEVRRCADAIGAIGLAGLAAAVRERFRGAEKRAKIFVSQAPDGREQRLYFKTPFRRGEKQEFLAAVRALPGRRWHPEKTANSVPVSSKRELWALFRRFWPGAYGESDEGVFRVPGDDPETGDDSAAAD